MGRPKLPDHLRQKMRPIRCMDGQWAFIAEAAASVDKDASTWVREELIKRAERVLGRKLKEGKQ